MLAQVGIEGFEKGFVEVRHRLTLLKAGEEGGAVHAVEGCRGPVQHLDEAERLQAAGVGKLLEQRPQHGRAQMPDRGAPVERTGRRRSCALRQCPKHPGREDAVEQGLHQGGMEEVRAALPLKPDAERLFQGDAHGLERRIPRRLDTGESIACVGGKQPSQVLRLGQRGAVRQRTGEVFAESGAGVTGEGTRLFQSAKEILRVVGQPKRFEYRGTACRVLTHQHEIADVRHQYQAVAVPIAADLSGFRGEPGIVIGSLHLDHAALWCLALARPAFLHLPRRVEAEVGMPGALVGKLADTEHLWLERPADGIQQIDERPVTRPLPCCAARCAHPSKIGEVRLDGRHQFCARCHYHPIARRGIGDCWPAVAGCNPRMRVLLIRKRSNAILRSKDTAGRGVRRLPREESTTKAAIGDDDLRLAVGVAARSESGYKAALTVANESRPRAYDRMFCEALRLMNSRPHIG